MNEITCKKKNEIIKKDKKNVEEKMKLDNGTNKNPKLNNRK